MLHTLRKNLSPAFCPCEDTSYPLRSDHLRNLIENLSVSDHAPVILCVGTDRIIGDSLGPMVGTMLMKLARKQLPIYGTLDHTVNALNIHEKKTEIKKKHPHSVIIAVDASLGSYENIGSVYVRCGSLHPGAGVHKHLPGIGDIAITGITGTQSSQPYLALQTARLSTIHRMAETISHCIMSVCL